MPLSRRQRVASNAKNRKGENVDNKNNYKLEDLLAHAIRPGSMRLVAVTQDRRDTQQA